MGKLHDLSSRLLFRCAGAALVVAVALYAFEVVARYLFAAPTSWSSEAVQYCLAILIFGALPEVTRRKAHVAIEMVPEALAPPRRALLMRLNGLLAAGTCLAAGAVVAREALKQFDRGLLTNAAHPIPRWWITAVIMIGLISAGLHFVRETAARRDDP